MEKQKLEIKQLCSKFMLTGMAAHLETTVTEAEKQGSGFMQFTLTLLQSEVNQRQSKDEAKRLNQRGCPGVQIWDNMMLKKMVSKPNGSPN